MDDKEAILDKKLSQGASLSYPQGTGYLTAATKGLVLQAIAEACTKTKEATLADVKAMLEGLCKKQGITTDGFIREAILQDAISQLSNLQEKPHCETCNAEGYKGKDGKFIHTSMQQAEPDEICANCNQWIYLDMEGDWVHRKPVQKHSDWRLCEDGRVATPEFNDKKE